MGRSYLLRLSWPSPALSSNARGHWSKKAKAVRAYRLEAWAVAKNRMVPHWPHATLTFTFYPPDRQRRDAQNLPHMMKPVIDGIADAVGVDDHGFRCVFPSRLADPVKGGVVMVEIGEAPAG